MTKIFYTILLCQVWIITTAQTITTIAGNGSQSFSGDGGPDSASTLNYPSGVAVDKEGNVFIADYENHRIRKIEISSHIISTVAGDGNRGFRGDNGQATEASLNHPSAIAVDDSGNVYIADTDNHRVRRVDVQSKTIRTIAGTGENGFNGDQRPAADAFLNGPTDVTLDSVGNVYIADRNNHRIRKISKSTSLISTVAGIGLAGSTGDGSSAAAAKLNHPAGICLDKWGNIYIADQDNNSIRKVTIASATIIKLAGTYGFAGAGFAGDGLTASGAKLFGPGGVAADTAGNIYIADLYNNAVRKITTSDSIINTIAGTGGFFNSGFSGDNGPATEAKLRLPSGIAVDKAGNIYIADLYNNRIRKVTMPLTTTLVFTFTGNGNWTDKLNWFNEQIPPAVLPAGSEIIINHQLPTAECLLNTRQVLLPGSKLTIGVKKKLKIPGEIGVR